MESTAVSNNSDVDGLEHYRNTVIPMFNKLKDKGDFARFATECCICEPTDFSKYDYKL